MPVATAKCPACRETNEVGTEFCLFCGSFLPWEGESGEGAPSADAVVDAPSSPRSAPSSTTAAAPPPLLTDGAATARTLTMPAVTLELPVSRSVVPDPDGRDGVEAPWRTCPACRRENGSARRFCARCGQRLDSTVVQRPAAPPSRLRAWWSRIWDQRDRAARRAYRRSLPPLYRWRRVVVGLLVLALAAGAAVLVHRNPWTWLQSQWYLRRNEYVRVLPSTVTTQKGVSAQGTDPRALVDQNQAEWTINWEPHAGAASGCSGAPGTGSVVVTFPEARVRRVWVHAGLEEGNPDRTLQARPKQVSIGFGDGPCTPYALPDEADPAAAVPADSGSPVTTMRLAVDSAYDGTDDATLLSIREIRLEALPNGR